MYTFYRYILIHYVDQLLLSNGLRIAVFLTLTTSRTTKWGPVIYGLVKYRILWTGNDNNLFALCSVVCL